MTPPALTYRFVSVLKLLPEIALPAVIRTGRLPFSVTTVVFRMFSASMRTFTLSAFAAVFVYAAVVLTFVSAIVPPTSPSFCTFTITRCAATNELPCTFHAWPTSIVPMRDESVTFDSSTSSVAEETQPAYADEMPFGAFELLIA